MKRIIFIVLFFISAGNCFGQQVTFQKTYGGAFEELGSSVQQTNDGGYIVAGTTTSFGAGSVDVYLIKTDPKGHTLWTKTFGGNYDEYGRSVQQTTDGGYIITGDTWSFGSGYGDVYLIRTDVNGDTLWTKTFGGSATEFGISVQQTTDGGYVVAGITASFGAGGYDVYLIKTDPNGDSLWTKTFGGTGTEYGRSVQQTMDGGYIISGWTDSFGAGNADFYLIKADSSGNTLWTKAFGGTDYDFDWFHSVQQTSDGGYVITGSTQSFGAGSNDVYLIKFDSNGDSLWSKTLGGIGDDYGTSVHQTSDGGYIIAGTTYSFGAGIDDIYLIKTNTNGDTLWTKTFGGTDYDGAGCVQKTTDGGYIITGWTSSYGAGFRDIYLIKTDSLGNSGCNEGGTATIVASAATQVTSPATIVTSPATIVTTPATIVGSGGIVTTLCTTVGIQSAIQNPKSEISISPNPATNNFTITFPNTINKGGIEIYDVIGKKIYIENFFNASQREIYLKNSAAGIYFVKVKDGEKEYSQKLVIQ